MKRKLSVAAAKALAAAATGLLLAGGALGAPRYKALHNFGNGQDGAGVWDSVVFDQNGDLYGTTSGGGAYGYGTVFQLTPSANGTWSESVLHSFDFHVEGAAPTGGLILDGEGNLYGTAPYGGSYGVGDVFELAPGSAGWTETVLYSFGAHSNDAYAPYAGLVMDNPGNLFGTGHVVFEVSPGSGGWTEKVIHRFTKPHDGGGPFAGLILDAAGNFYGTTEGGGDYRAGTVYEVRYTANGWKERVLHSFSAFPNDGRGPGVGALTFDASGRLYGTTLEGGSNICYDIGCGTIFRLTRGSKGRWRESVLYNFNFKGDGTSGYGPGAGVVVDKAGNLYGTTFYGGSSQCECGVVYKLVPQAKGRWKYTVLHTFYGTDGAQPDANLILDSKGNLYGTTAIGGIYDGGVVFEITP